jgi:folate-dependent phosphoribosylglycinamide formyltransferase PurN
MMMAALMMMNELGCTYTYVHRDIDTGPICNLCVEDTS